MLLEVADAAIWPLPRELPASIYQSFASLL